MQKDAISLLANLPPVFERYELKYVIPFALVEPICRFIEPCCALDAHTLSHPDRFYPVNSLYFDTPNYRFLKLRMWGAAHRFNMRVRAYGDGRSGPRFAEVKYKNPTSVKKFRAALDAADWPEFLNESSCGLTTNTTEDSAVVSRLMFLRLAESYAIEPKIFTCYRRRAYFSTIDDYARVTFDVDMRYRPQDPITSASPFSLSPGSDCINYDNEAIYDDETNGDANVILELKAAVGAVPVWMVELIRRFQLQQVGFSKYLNSSLVQHGDDGWHYMTSDRVSAAV